MRIHSYLLDNEILLYCEAGRAIYRLNPSASFLWCCHEEGLSEEQMQAELADVFSIDSMQAKRDVAATVGEWRQLGLLGGILERQPSYEDDWQSTGETELDSERVDLAPAPGSGVIRRYRILDQIVEIKYPDEILLKMAGVALASLLTDMAATRQHHFTVAQLKKENEFVLMYGEQLVAHCRTVEALAPLLLAQVVSTVYLETPCLLGLHAAAVGKHGQCLVMPAESGSGKSTLTAALAACGFDYYTDELVLVMHDSHSLLTASVGMGIKPGSWRVLSDYYADLERCPVHPRPDGKQVRYLNAPNARSVPLDSVNPVRALVFPQYKAGQSACLTTLSTADALCRLASAGYDIEAGLSQETVEAMIGWVDSLDCYELVFDELEKAVAIAEGLLL